MSNGTNIATADRKQYWFVIKELTAREIKRKFSRSYLGIAWSVLNPLLSMVVLSLIFTQIFKRSIENFPIYYLTGILIWQLFTDSSNHAMTTLVDNKTLLIKVKFPMQVFILARMYTALVNMLYSLVTYVLLIFVFKIGFSPTMFLYPLIILFVLLFSLGISYILSVAYVFFGDVKHLYSVLLTLWMYCSAIFYPVNNIEGVIRTVIDNNPMFVFINSARNVMMYAQVPSIMDFTKMIVWSVGMYLIGYRTFNKHKNQVMQKL
ncbi:MAG: ABC transporter permease [Suipraeoptans sp.]